MASMERIPANVVRALLTRGGPGRIGMSANALPAVLPTNFVYLGGSIVCATEDDSVARAGERAAVLAFSADEIDPEGRWQWHAHAVGKTETVTDDNERADLAMLGLFPPGAHHPAHYIRLQPEILTGSQFATRIPTELERASESEPTRAD
jgi:hypothetical protein